MWRSARFFRRAFRRAYSTPQAEAEEMRLRLTKSNRLLTFYMGAAAAATTGALAYQLYGTELILALHFRFWFSTS